MALQPGVAGRTEPVGIVPPILDDVTPDLRHEKFDSLFEQRVFLDLAARGYHVTPQVESNQNFHAANPEDERLVTAIDECAEPAVRLRATAGLLRSLRR